MPMNPSSTGTARPETRFVCGTGSDGLFLESRAMAAVETAKVRVRERKYIVRN